MPSPQHPDTGQRPPPDLYDEDHCLLAVRAEGKSRGQARALFARELAEDFTKIKVRKTTYRYAQEYADDMEADGIPEPYDGWPWWECGPGETGTDYWQLVSYA